MGGISRGFHAGAAELGTVEMCRSTIFVLCLGAVYLICSPLFSGKDLNFLG